MEPIIVDAWRCPQGSAHQWVYRGRTVGGYHCLLCAALITKNALKEATDA